MAPLGDRTYTDWSPGIQWTEGCSRVQQDRQLAAPTLVEPSASAIDGTDQDLYRPGVFPRQAPHVLAPQRLDFSRRATDACGARVGAIGARALGARNVRCRERGGDPARGRGLVHRARDPGAAAAVLSGVAAVRAGHRARATGPRGALRVRPPVRRGGAGCG